MGETPHTAGRGGFRLVVLHISGASGGSKVGNKALGLCKDKRVRVRCRICGMTFPNCPLVVETVIGHIEKRHPEQVLPWPEETAEVMRQLEASDRNG